MSTSISFEILLSKSPSRENILLALKQLLPNLQIDVVSEDKDFPADPSPIWARIVLTTDPDWPAVLECLNCPEKCNLGKYPDLVIAAHLGRVLKVNALCGITDFIKDIDPHDPYYYLAYVNGQWHLASESKIAQGKKSIQLVRPIDLPAET